MYIYNVTVNIERSIEKDWLRWMQEKHIPEMLATGKFFEAKMCEVMVDEPQGITYSVQYTAENKATLERYYQENADQLRKEGQILFKEKLVAFRTELKVINHVKNFVKS
jgi:ABC-type ATPase with predicted acetyltransferase domain